MSTPHSEVTSVLGRGELSHDRRESLFIFTLDMPYYGGYISVD